MDPTQLAEVEALYAKTHMGVTWHPSDFRTILTPEACAYVAAALNAFPALAQALRAALAASEAIVARVEAVDPLEVSSDWDNGESIAHSVHRACVKAARGTK